MKALKTPKPGDLFYIPALDKSDTPGFVIARYIELIKPNLGHLIEVFEKFYTKIPNSLSDVDTSERLFRPIFCSMRFSEIPRWKILFSDPHYDKSQSNYDAISFAFHSDLWVGGTGKAATPDQLESIEPSVCWRMHHIVFRVIAHLKGAVAKEENMDYHKLPEELRIDNDTAKERVEHIATVIDEKMRNIKN